MTFPDQTDGPIQAQTIHAYAEDRITIDTPEQIALEFPLAGIGSRFMAMALDTVIQVLLYVAGIFAIVGVAKFAPMFSLWPSWMPTSWAPAIVILFLFCVYWGYFAFFEVIWTGRTPGKRAAGIRAIHESGRALNVYEVIGRNLMRAVDALPFLYGVGIITAMISRKNQRLGDLLVGSIVVHDRKVESVQLGWSSPAEKRVATPQVATISAEELVLIETYLQRRLSLDFAVRDATASQIAARIIAKTGITRPPDQSLDEFLECVAKQIRDIARYR